MLSAPRLGNAHSDDGNKGRNMFSVIYRGLIACSGIQEAILLERREQNLQAQACYRKANRQVLSFKSWMYKYVHSVSHNLV